MNYSRTIYTRLFEMKKISVIFFFAAFPLMIMGAVGDMIRVTTEEGIPVLYAIKSEPPARGYPGYVSVGWSTDNSYAKCVDEMTEGSITIPSLIERGGKSYVVNSVANHAFDGCASITSIVLPNGVTDIGDYVFANCASLADLILPSDLRSIGKAAFADCNSIATIAFPDEMTTIQENTFSNCNKLRNISFNNISAIRSNAFHNCNELESASFFRPMSIKGNAFSGCTSLESVSFYNEELFLLDHQAFNGCMNLKSVYSFVTKFYGGSIFSDSFYGINTEAILYVGADMIESYRADYNWSKYFRRIIPRMGEMFDISLVDGDEEIGINVEVTCTDPLRLCINSLTDPSHIDKQIYIPSHVVIYDDNYIVDKIGESLFKETGITNLTIEEGIRSIGDDAFAECNSLSHVTIPKSITEMGKAFYMVDALQSIVVKWRDLAKVRIDSENFINISHSAALYVPAGTKERYAEHEVWGRFSQIIESGPISTGDISARYGSRVDLPIYLKNEEVIEGLQFKLTLPEGVSVAEDEAGLITSTTDRTSGMTIMGSKDPEEDNSYIFVLLSLEGNAISGNEGAIMNIKLNIAPDVALGDYEIKMEGVYMTTSSYETLNPAESTSDLMVTDIMLGDVNNDGIINVTDAIGVVNYILKNTPSSFVEGAADVNQDGIINITDAIGVVNMILGNGSSPRMIRANTNEPQ